jgi:hypothetical protein
VETKEVSGLSEEKVWFCQECRRMMEPVNEDFCRCPECGTEVWYKYSRDKVKADEVEQLMQDNIVHHQKNVYEAMVGGRPVKGKGGGGSKGRNKKSIDKPTQNELYKRLSQ